MSIITSIPHFFLQKMQTISFSFSQIVNVVILPNITLYEFFIFLMVVSIPNFFLFICFLKNINEKNGYYKSWENQH